MFAVLVCATSLAALRGELSTSRRGALVAAAAAIVGPPKFEAAAAEPASIDRTRTTHLFGLAPPHLEGQLTYDQLLAAASNGQVATVQMAVQHNWVVATTPHGARWICEVKDSEMPIFLADAMRTDGSMPFEVLPIDAGRAKVRDVFFRYVGLVAAIYGADQLDMLPFDLTGYGSIKEREEANEARMRGEAPPEKPLAAALRSLIARVKAAGDAYRSPGSGAEGARGAGGAAEGGPQDEELRRVLGLRPLASEIRSKVLSSEAHRQVVKTHDRMVDEFREGITQLGEGLRSAPWVTPSSLGTAKVSELPPLEELFSSAWLVGTDSASGVSQYLRATPVSSGPVLRLATVPAASRRHPGILLQLEANTNSRVPSYTGRLQAGQEGNDSGFESEWGLCRCCPEFTKLYGHRVYVCKKPAQELSEFMA